MIDDERTARASPDEAFAVLANETRLAILRALGEENGPLSFSELFARVDYDTTANFSYHLEKLEGPFVVRTEDAYELRQAGRRIVEAVLSGAVTDDPVVERTPVPVHCNHCEGTLEVDYRDEYVGIYCPACGGTREATSPTAEWALAGASDVVGHVALPPAGVYDRTPTQLLRAGEVWTVTEAHALARGVCPRCGAPVETDLDVCEGHDGTSGSCPDCDQRFGVTVHVTCTNCILDERSIFTKHLLATPELMAFMLEHDVDPLAPDGFHVTALEETIRSTDPFEADFTFRADGDAVTLTVDESLSVVATSRSSTTPTG